MAAVVLQAGALFQFQYLQVCLWAAVAEQEEHDDRGYRIGRIETLNRKLRHRSHFQRRRHFRPDDDHSWRHLLGEKKYIQIIST